MQGQPLTEHPSDLLLQWNSGQPLKYRLPYSQASATHHHTYDVRGVLNLLGCLK